MKCDYQCTFSVEMLPTSKCFGLKVLELASLLHGEAKWGKSLPPLTETSEQMGSHGQKSNILVFRLVISKRTSLESNILKTQMPGFLKKRKRNSRTLPLRYYKNFVSCTRENRAHGHIVSKKILFEY